MYEILIVCVVLDFVREQIDDTNATQAQTADIGLQGKAPELAPMDSSG